MANLNFQQPPRSIASASLTGRSTGGSFGANSLSGHVTPTSGMFPPGSGASSYGQSQQPPQLSPNRSAQQQLSSASVGGVPPQMSNSSRSSLFGQRTFADRRAMAGLGGPMSNMGTFMQSSRGYGSQSGSGLNNFHSVFGGSGRDAGTPPLLDLSEFPSLTNSRGQSDGGSQQTSGALQPPGSKPYVGMVKQPTSEQSEFQMSSEDFPALPGTQATDGSVGVVGPGGMVTPGGIDGNGEKLIREGGPMTGQAGMGMELQSDSLVGGVTEKALKRGVQTSPDGKVTNIPASMVNNQFGMVGLLTFIRAAESDPNLVSLAMGQDLTTLGLNLNSPENLYPAFGGPFSDQPCRPQDIDFHVPPEYMVNMSIRDKLAQPVLKKYKDDLLFFLFYTNVGDVMQLAAAAELHSRDWRYHIEEKVWISRLPGISHYDKNGTTERGTYYYFDAQNWRRVVKDLQIDTGKLDKCPNLNAIVSLSGQPV